LAIDGATRGEVTRIINFELNSVGLLEIYKISGGTSARGGEINAE
jgi:hypothetical protein